MVMVSFIVRHPSGPVPTTFLMAVFSSCLIAVGCLLSPLGANGPLQMILWAMPSASNGFFGVMFGAGLEVYVEPVMSSGRGGQKLYP